MVRRRFYPGGGKDAPGGLDDDAIWRPDVGNMSATKDGLAPPHLHWIAYLHRLVSKSAAPADIIIAR